MTLQALIDSVGIADVWQGLGGEAPDGKGMAPPFYRQQKQPGRRSVKLNTELATWFDFGLWQGGGTIALIRLATGTDSAGAVRWLEDFAGQRLDDRDSTPAEREQARRAREAAREEAEALLIWRDWMVGAVRRQYLRYRRAANAVNRKLLDRPHGDISPRWLRLGAAAHAAEIRAGELLERLDRLRSASPGELLPIFREQGPGESMAEHQAAVAIARRIVAMLASCQRNEAAA